MWGVRGGRDGLLYVGKAERRLRGRGLWTLFNTGRTGRSTLRRTLAALLADGQGLAPTPVTLPAPLRLTDPGERVLAAGMIAHLSVCGARKDSALRRWPPSRRPRSKPCTGH